MYVRWLLPVVPRARNRFPAKDTRANFIGFNEPRAFESRTGHLLGINHSLPEKDALGIASLVCLAIQHMHQRGVIHRDLKPGNIIVCRDRTIRVMDFGIASPNRHDG